MLNLSLKKAGISISSLPKFVSTTLQNQKEEKFFTSQEPMNSSLISKVCF